MPILSASRQLTHRTTTGIPSAMSEAPTSAHPGPAHPAIAMLVRETRLREGTAPREIGGVAIAPGKQRLVDDCFLLHTESGSRYFYQKGEGIIAEYSADRDPAEDSLWRNGSVYAAIACINGLYPIHASAVAVGGQVFAFTGASGAGKSTLVAELTRRGLPLFCDDTLVLDLSQPGRIVCLPGHKRLKLWPDALAMTGARAQEQVMAALPKFYAEPVGEVVTNPLPLAELCFLEHGSTPRIEPLTGGEKLVRLQDDHYTTEMYLAASRPDRLDRFRQLAQLARTLRLTRFVRPRDSDRFSADAALVAQHILMQAEGTSPPDPDR